MAEQDEIRSNRQMIPCSKRFPKKIFVEDRNANDGAAPSYEVFMFGPPGAVRESARKKTGRMKRTMKLMKVR